MSCVYRKLDSYGYDQICASGIASEHLICLIQDRPAAWAEPTTPTDSGPFSAESSFRYTQDFAGGNDWGHDTFIEGKPWDDGNEMDYDQGRN